MRGSGPVIVCEGVPAAWYAGGPRPPRLAALVAGDFGVSTRRPDVADDTPCCVRGGDVGSALLRLRGDAVGGGSSDCPAAAADD